MPVGPVARSAFVVLLGLSGCLGKIDPDATASRTNASGIDGTAGEPPRGPGATPPAGTAPAPGASSGATTLLGLGYPPDALTNDDAYVYWTELNTVFRASKVAPVREPLFGDGTAPSTSVVVDDLFVYAVDNIPGSVRAWPKSGGAVQLIVPEGARAATLAQDAANLYVGQWDHGGLRVVSKSSHAATTTLRAGESVTQIAIAGDVVFTAETDDSSNYRIVRSNLDGTGAAQVVGQTTSTVYQLVASGNDAYWTDERGLMSTRGDVALYAAAKGGYVAAGLSVIGDHVYVTEVPYPMEPAGAKVLRVPRDWSAPSVIANLTIDGPSDAFRVYGVRQTNDASSLYITAYWTSDTGSARGDTISRVAIP